MQSLATKSWVKVIFKDFSLSKFVYLEQLNNFNVTPIPGYVRGSFHSEKCTINY